MVERGMLLGFTQYVEIKSKFRCEAVAPNLTLTSPAVSFGKCTVFFRSVS